MPESKKDKSKRIISNLKATPKGQGKSPSISGHPKVITGVDKRGQVKSKTYSPFDFAADAGAKEEAKRIGNDPYYAQKYVDKKNGKKN